MWHILHNAIRFVIESWVSNSFFQNLDLGIIWWISVAGAQHFAQQYGQSQYSLIKFLWYSSILVFSYMDFEPWVILIFSFNIVFISYNEFHVIIFNTSTFFQCILKEFCNNWLPVIKIRHVRIIEMICNYDLTLSFLSF